MAHRVLIIDGKEPNEGVGGVSAADFSHLAVRFYEPGVVGINDYKVSAQDTPDMTVAVAPGKAYVPNSAGSMLYPTELDTGINVTIDPNTSGNDRIDTIVIAVDTQTTPNEHANDVVEVVAVKGEPGSAPVPLSDNEIQTELGSGYAWLKLAEVTVENGTSSITSGDVSDMRTAVGLKAAGIMLDEDDMASNSATKVPSQQSVKAYVDTKRVGSVTSSTTPTPDADAHDIYLVTALAAGATFGAPTGTPKQGQGLIIRIKDNGTARTLAWNSVYRGIGSALPTTTVISKTMYVGCIYNATDSKWDVIAVSQEE